MPYPLGVTWCATDRAYNFALYSNLQGDNNRYVMVNGSSESVPFVIQEVGAMWHVDCRYRAAIPEDIELSHGRTGIRRLLLGSVAEKIVRHAPCFGPHRTCPLCLT